MPRQEPMAHFPQIPNLPLLEPNKSKKGGIQQK